MDGVYSRRYVNLFNYILIKSMLTDLYNTFFYCYVFQGRTTINISDGITVKDKGILISVTELQLKKVKKGTFVI